MHKYEVNPSSGFLLICEMDDSGSSSSSSRGSQSIYNTCYADGNLSTIIVMMWRCSVLHIIYNTVSIGSSFGHDLHMRTLYMYMTCVRMYNDVYLHNIFSKMCIIIWGCMYMHHETLFCH